MTSKIKRALIYAQFIAVVIFISVFFITWMAFAVQFYFVSTSSLLFTVFALVMMVAGLAHGVMVGRYLWRSAKKVTRRTEPQ